MQNEGTLQIFKYEKKLIFIEKMHKNNFVYNDNKYQTSLHCCVH